MWEITLIGNKEDFIHFAMLEEVLKSITTNPPIIAITYESNLYCSIAVSDRKQIGIVKKHILECIIKICKEEYFRDNIKHLGDDIILNNFILVSLTYIDLEDELDYARYRIKFTKKLHVRSLVRFRLNRLYLVWEKFVNYFNISLANNFNNRIYLDFLKFLASNTSSKTDIMFVEEGNNNMCILDKNRKLIKSAPKNDEIELIVSLIVYSPKKVIINCLDSLSNRVSNLLKYIFEDKICVLL